MPNKTATVRLVLGALAGLAAVDGTHSMRASGKLNVHLVCHTHDDAGWLKTVDQYYYGANNTIAHAGVQYILDSVVAALEEDPARRFVYAEQAFMWRWWRQQGPEKRKLVRKLVSEGRLSFVNGGWVMHDEATAHYVGMIDQTHLGHSFLHREFGEEALPRVAWQIDPFGHSATQASLLGAQAGFEALYFGRIDYQDREKRIAARDMEMLWRASRSLEERAQIFTGVFRSGNYGPPVGFCFDQACHDEPIMSDPVMADYNAERRASEFADACQEMARNTRGDDIMLQMGGDFGFENANAWFKNLDVLMEAVNREGRVNAFYSTPEMYTEAKHSSGLDWSVKMDDFFPYADCPNCYWTGFYTSRPGLKRLERVTSGYLQAARQLHALTSPGRGEEEASGWRALEALERAQALVQHHDGVTGTSKQHVADDYAQRLDHAWVRVEAAVSAALSRLAFGEVRDRDGSPGDVDGDFTRLRQCRLANVSICDITVEAENDFVAVAYNPLAQRRAGFIDVPISWPAVCVTDSEGRAVESQIMPFRHRNLMPRHGRGEEQRQQHPYTLVLPITRVRPLSVEVFYVSRAESCSQRVSRTSRGETGEPAEPVELAVAAERGHVSPDAVVEGGAHEHEVSRGAENLLETSGIDPGTVVRDRRLASSDDRDFSISNDLVTLTFDGTTGRLSRMETHGNGVGGGAGEEGASIDVDQGWFFYPSFDVRKQSAEAVAAPHKASTSARLHRELPERLGDSEGQRGGAYILRAGGQGKDQRAFPVGAADGGEEERSLRVKEWWIEEGPLVSEVHQVFSSWVTQTIRLRRGQAHAELDWSVGPIPVGGGDDASGSAGKEVISRFSAPSLASGGAFYTDANGREFQKRVRDRRPTWDLNVTQPVAGNYYPVTAAAFVRGDDDGLQLSVLTDRAQGCSSLADGDLELLAHRRLLTEDERGVGEALNETTGGMSHYPDWKRKGDGEVFRGTHYLVLSMNKDGMKDVRALMDEVFSPFVAAFGEKGDARYGSPPPPPLMEEDTGVSGYSESERGNEGLRWGLANNLPANVGLVTLTTAEKDRGGWRDGSEEETHGKVSLLIRLAHRYAEGEHAVMSQPATVLLSQIIRGHSLVHAEEIALTGGVPLAARSQRLQWTTTDATNTDITTSRPRGRVTWDAYEIADAPAVSDEEAASGLKSKEATIGQESLYWQVTIGPMEVRTFRLQFQL